MRRRRRAAKQVTFENGHVEGMTPPPPAGSAALDDLEPPVAEALPAKLLNNAAVLHAAAGQPGTALQLLEEAVQVCMQSLFGDGGCMLVK